MTDPLVPNDAFVVDDVEGWSHWRIPSFSDRAIIGKTAPVELVGVLHFLQLVGGVRKVIDTQQ